MPLPPQRPGHPGWSIWAMDSETFVSETRGQNRRIHIVVPLPQTTHTHSSIMPQGAPVFSNMIGMFSNDNSKFRWQQCRCRRPRTPTPASCPRVRFNGIYRKTKITVPDDFIGLVMKYHQPSDIHQVQTYNDLKCMDGPADGSAC